MGKSECILLIQNKYLHVSINFQTVRLLQTGHKKEGEQKTGGSKTNVKQLTLLEEKLMEILSWLTVSCANVPEIGINDENKRPVERIEKQDCNKNELVGIESLISNNSK